MSGNIEVHVLAAVVALTVLTMASCCMHDIHVDINMCLLHGLTARFECRDSMWQALEADGTFVTNPVCLCAKQWLCASHLSSSE